MSILASETADELYAIADAVKEWVSARREAMTNGSPETFDRLAKAEHALCVAHQEYEG